MICVLIDNLRTAKKYRLIRVPVDIKGALSGIIPSFWYQVAETQS